MAAAAAAAGHAVNLPTVNRQIVEIKKKIQLSEGQRRALFEEIETERRKNSEELLTLKKEIAKLAVSLHELRSKSLKKRISVTQLQNIIGHVGEKTCSEAIEILDLHLIDRNKQLDLLKYKIKKKESELTKLAKEYQELLTVSLPVIKNEKQSNKSLIEMRNKVNAVEVQWREAEHIKVRYREIKRSLMDDAALFESRVKKISEDIEGQDEEIRKLQKVNSEACKLRNAARSALLSEERNVVSSGITRERQANEGKRLVQERKQDLENLEKSFYQGLKPQIKVEHDEDSPREAASPPDSNEDPLEKVERVFETLKEATGGNSITDVFQKFQAQRETQTRLSELREKSEAFKKKLEATQDKYRTDFEKLKFVESKDAEQNAEELEKINVSIVEQKNRKVVIRLEMDNVHKAMENIKKKLQAMYVSFNRENIEEDPFAILKYLNEILTEAMERKAEEDAQRELLEGNEEKWLPNPYTEIVRRTPLPQHGSPIPAAPVQASDDEEEVPSRGYLKRQAQLVVDAKLKRKNMRFQMARLK